jgi:1-acyl-sn-glycerol-3-phosphate acyltransferase
MFWNREKLVPNKKAYSKINLFVRSFIFSIFSILSMLLYSLFVVTLFFMPLKVRHALVRGFLAAYLYMLKKVCLIDYEVTGLQHVPKGLPGIVLSKHQSTWETFFLPLVFKDPAIILKQELLWIPFFGWGLAAIDPIAINRRSKGTAMQQIIAKGKKCLDAGRWIIVFPEGTRTAPGTIGNYKLGGARLATATGHPVIPVAHNAGRYWPRRKFIKRPGTIQVVIGPVIETKDKTADEVLALAKDWIEETMRRLD